MQHSLLPLLAVAGGAAAFPAKPQARAAAAGVQFAGVNIAGFDFGCSTTGACDLTKVVPPLSSLGGPDGAGQMQHFTQDDGLNIFRLPVGWQYLVNNNLGGTLDSGNFGRYDQLVQACLATGAYCMLDVNARWNGQIIGQGGPQNDQFTSLWTQLATKYANQTKVIFGVMNEPHDVPDIGTWADTVQAVVTAIRAVAKTQMIALPGNDWTSAQAMPTKSGPALLKVKNPDGTTDGLIIDVHKYLDSDNSGTHTECVTDNVSDTFQPLATWLKTNNRTAILSETGGGNTDSCKKYFCQQLDFLNQNSDVFLGYIGWAAGSFDPTTYELSEVPTKNGNTWTDSALVQACLKRT
ncbi:glycoside hydrolase family 5 protein [Thermothielavioides terrestris NRRL 8126]|uniref:Endoglucanase EG-II n=1 Tax=Thermothielavioides terrestris (strain ATCC 38088 / NRRL 8126) TaxID=578455 RepID=G2QZE6_THETT|nr:glycoside hydrolase family 5 protein [Thermothielavioides terrestris NRRL 8126]AEO67179.1 glycoside hydrolase family 5 protein [Thermothielavioides terrestris NRRL 8126]